MSGRTCFQTTTEYIALVPNPATLAQLSIEQALPESVECQDGRHTLRGIAQADTWHRAHFADSCKFVELTRVKIVPILHPAFDLVWSIRLLHTPGYFGDY